MSHVLRKILKRMRSAVVVSLPVRPRPTRVMDESFTEALFSIAFPIAAL
jgi:hypothetical protein